MGTSKPSQSETKSKSSINAQSGREPVSRIVYFGQTMGLGGAETFLSDLLGEFVRRGVNVTAYTNHRPFEQLLAKKGVSAKHIPWVVDVVGDWKGLVKAAAAAPLALVWYWRALRRERRAEVVLVSGFAEKLILSWWCWLKEKQIVWIEFAPLAPLFAKFWGLPKWGYRLSTRLPALVIVPTDYTVRPLIDQAWVSTDKITVVPCGRGLNIQNTTEPGVTNGGMDKKVENVNTTTVIETRSDSSLSDTTATLVCVSRLEQGKGQDLLIRAMTIIVKKRPDTQLRIVGEGDFDTQLTRLVAELGLTRHVTLTGRVPDALAELRAATVCVFPSVWALEGFGMVTIEAMALGKPIVAFKTGPTPYIVEHEQTSLLAQPGSVDDLAAQILRLLGDERLRRRLGDNARRRYQRQYRISQVADQYLRVLAETRQMFKN